MPGALRPLPPCLLEASLDGVNLSASAQHRPATAAAAAAASSSAREQSPALDPSSRDPPPALQRELSSVHTPRTPTRMSSGRPEQLPALRPALTPPTRAAAPHAPPITLTALKGTLVMGAAHVSLSAGVPAKRELEQALLGRASKFTVKAGLTYSEAPPVVASAGGRDVGGVIGGSSRSRMSGGLPLPAYAEQRGGSGAAATAAGPGALGCPSLQVLTGSSIC